MNENLKNVTVLYVVSASRSGSTIIERILGGLDGVINVGELRRLRDFYNENRSAIVDPKAHAGCTCGLQISECAFWKDVEKEAGLDFSSVILTSNAGVVNRTLLKFVFLLGGPGLVRWLSNYYNPFKMELEAAKTIVKIYSAISTISETRYIVDSSKMLHNYLLLKTIIPQKIKMIALFRDGRAVTKSMIRGDRKQYYLRGKYYAEGTCVLSDDQFFRKVVLYWVKDVVFSLLFYLRTPKRQRFFVRYEDFCLNSQKMIDNMVARFRLKRSIKMRTTDSYDISHSIGGSPSRFRPKSKKIVLDEKWRKNWNKDEHIVFNLYGRLINRILGYK